MEIIYTILKSASEERKPTETTGEAGYFKENELKNNVYSFGIGTTLLKFATGKENDKYQNIPFYLKESSFLINYSFVREIGKTANNNFHFLSIEFPF